jgi:hypothetical protein
LGDEMLNRATLHEPNVPSALLRMGRRFGSWPAIVFALISLSFGSAIILVMPPLRGPDEISHFLRIYSYVRGELPPTTEVNGRKGVFVESALYDRLYFFKDSGEWFAKSLQQRKGKWFDRPKEEGIRYGQIMAEYRDIASTRRALAIRGPPSTSPAGNEVDAPT